MTALGEPEAGLFDESLRRPPLSGEAAAAFELASLLPSGIYYGAGVPRGAGRAVLVIPGFLGGDEYLRIMRGWLQRIGYDAHASGIIFNWGTPATLIAGLVRRVDQIAARRGGRLIVIGHSLGGIFARALLLQRPDCIAHAICLGSPLQGDPRRAAHPFIGELARVLVHERGGFEAGLEASVLDPPLPDSVRLTSLYSRDDAVVDWRTCFDRDPNASGIEVHGTHCGLVWNAEVYRQVATLLAMTGA